MYRVLTVSREFGSGGAQIARMVADQLGWRLLDNTLIMDIARAAGADPEMVRRLDEQVDSWLHRVSRHALWHGAFEAVAQTPGTGVLDAETVTALANSLIREACEQGNCVIVGRGAQCVLQERKDVFHVFVYAPWRHKVARLRGRLPAQSNIEELIESTEQMRTQYVKLHFGCDRNDPHLYDLLISSALGEEAAASVILCAMKAAGARSVKPHD